MGYGVLSSQLTQSNWLNKGGREQSNEDVLPRLRCAVRGLLQRLSKASDTKGPFGFGGCAAAFGEQALNSFELEFVNF